jgi:hypothetical protein
MTFSLLLMVVETNKFHISEENYVKICSHLERFFISSVLSLHCAVRGGFESDVLL